MIDSYKKYIHLAVTVVLFLGLAQPFLVQAQSSAPAALVEGLTVSPFFVEQRVEAGKPFSKEITVSNSTTSAITITPTIHDFIPSDDNQSRIILPTGESIDGPFALSPWLTVAETGTFLLAPGENKVIHVTVTPPATAEPGTRYAAVLFDYGTPGEPGNSSTEKQVGTIIITKLGLTDERGIITKFAINPSSAHINPIVSFETNFASTGNVSLRPKGRIEIRNMFGQLVSVQPVNRDALLIFPRTNRDFSATWQPHLAFGRYTAKLIFVYGDSRLEVSSQVSFWVFSWLRIVIGLVIAIALLFAMIYAVKKYNRWLIKRSS